jgi:hypothetical protein
MRWDLRPGRLRLDRRTALLGVAALAVLVVGFWLLGAVASALAGVRIRQEARERGLEAGWRSLSLGFPGRLHARDLAVIEPTDGDTVFRAAELRVGLSAWSMLRLQPAPTRIELEHALLRPWHSAARLDTLAPPDEEESGRGGPSAPRVMRAGDALVRALLAPARALPALSLRDVTLASADTDDGRAVVLGGLELRRERQGIHLAGTGSLEGEAHVPFELDLRYGHDDRLSGGARFRFPEPDADTLRPFVVAVDGRVEQDRRAREVRIGDPLIVSLGRTRVRVVGTLSRQGPAFRLAMAADSLDRQKVVESFPRALLGPLDKLVVRGSWDHRVSLDLDLSKPDSVRFESDVIPHALQLDLARTRLDLWSLDQPFTATVHLPRGQRVRRTLSTANPHFLTLDEIDPVLAAAVVTNEDGGFRNHRGFNTEAVRSAIAYNLKKGGYRRGAGTISMQLVRNLYLGHDRTLARKFQEVVLAWVLENLTWLPKDRLLEIYLNIIEWGPGVHGADEAADFYFGKSARELTVDEALFLTIVIPSPKRWRDRLDGTGALRPFARAQMHFIGRAMIRKGWLDPEALPTGDSLAVAITGRAGATFAPPAPPDSLLIPADSLAAPPAAAPAAPGTADTILGAVPPPEAPR